MSRKAFIIGAGVSGLVTGWKLLERGWDVEVFEREPYYGGMARTWRWGDFLIDVGPHLYHTPDPLIAEIWEREFGDLFVKALRAEGWPATPGGYEPVYLQPMYQQKIAFGSQGYPFTASSYGKEVDYSPGLCPVAERVYRDEFFDFPTQSFVPNSDENARIGPAIERILKHREVIESLPIEV